MAAAPQPVAVSAQPIEIVSPFPDVAVPRLWIWAQAFRSRVADDYAPSTLEEFVRDWERRAAAGRRSWGVERAGELGGMFCYDPITDGVGLVHTVFKKSFWGNETTLAALRIVLAELFDSGIRRVVFQCFADNASTVGLARKVGAVKEGVLRQDTMRGGKPVDVVVLGILKEDFEKWAS